MHEIRPNGQSLLRGQRARQVSSAMRRAICKAARGGRSGGGLEAVGRGLHALVRPELYREQPCRRPGRPTCPVRPDLGARLNRRN
jgi:hypothetical protein